jgi:Domain of unknown function (DUF4232)
VNRLRSLAFAVAATGTLAVAACGSIGSPTGTGAAGASPSASPAVSLSPRPSGQAVTVGTCSPSDLKISLDSAAAGIAAGSSYVPLEFANVSASPCTLPSYPGVTFASGASGPAIGPPAVQQDTAAGQTVVLAPGQLAHSWLQIVAAANYPAASCHPVTAQGLLISLTSSGPASFVADSVPACAQPPPGSATLSVFPVRAGQPQRGTVP